MLVVFFGFAVLPVPWRQLDAALVFGSSIVAYDILLAGVGHLDPSLFWTHNAVLWAGFLVATVLQRVISRQRLDNYLARQALASANERLKSLDAAKNHFFSNISHELRTPLTLIVAPLEALLESSREPRRASASASSSLNATRSGSCASSTTCWHSPRPRLRV
jgi:signal transduction histidine kinase